MDTLKLLYLIPYLLSLAISLGIGFYAVRRTHIAGAFALTLLAIGESSYISGYVLELLNTSVSGKLFWDNFQFLGTLAFPTGLFLFGIEYARQQTNHRPLTLGLLLIVPIVTVLAAYTNDAHHLMRTDSDIVSTPPFGELTYTYQLGVYIMVLYFYALIIVGLFLLIRAIFNSRSIYRAQVLTVLAGMLFPVSGSVLSILGIELGGHRDTAPFSFALSNIVVALGLFRFRLLDVVPIAHNKVLENMPDALFVIDKQHRIVDLNPSARAIIGLSDEQVLGKPASEVLSKWSSILAGFGASEVTYHQIENEIDGQAIYFDASLTALRSERGDALGHLIIARDVTSRKQTEDAERQQRAFAEALIEITKALNSTLDFDDLLELLLETIEQVVPYIRAEIGLIREGQVIIVGTRNKDVERPGMKLGPAGSLDKLPIVKIVEETRQPFLVADIAELANHPILADSNLVRIGWVKSFLGVPIFTSEMLTGFISLAHDTAGFYRDQHVTRVQTFAEQVAIAIENARLYQLAQSMAVAEERQRLARDIHDSVSQTLFASKTIAEVIRRAVPQGSEELAEYSQQLINLNKGAMSELRTLMLELRPNALEQTDIGTLLRLLADTFTGNSQIPVDVSAPDKLFLPRDSQIAFYRVAQEALNNVTRYANASHVHILLNRTTDKTELHIIDNGRGFDPAKVPTERLGIKLMHEHAANANAVLTIKSAEGEGTEVILSGS